MNNPLFSVLIANYNNGRFLQEAIDSVLEQTYPNWEVIIVDDKSTDNSFEIYEKYKDDGRFHIYYNEKNMGCGYTKHQCVLHSDGVYCGYLDPDDALLPNALEVSYKMMEANPNAVLTFSRHYLCDERMNITEESRPLVLKAGESYFEHHDYWVEHFAGFKREAYMKMGGLDVSLKAGVDADMFFRLEEVGDLEVSHVITYKYRIFDEQITADYTNIAYWNLIVQHNTCIRRGLDPSLYSFRTYLKVRDNLIRKGADQTRTTNAYRLGRFLLKPSTWIKKI